MNDPSEVVTRSATGVPLSKLAAPKVGGLRGWQIQRVQTFIKSHLDKAPAVPKLDSIAGVSRSHFSRAFRVSFKETPHSYLLGLRIERALILMNDTDHSLSEIAADCGFSDQAHFNRVFKPRLGCSPGALRRFRRNAFSATEITRAQN